MNFIPFGMRMDVILGTPEQIRLQGLEASTLSRHKRYVLSNKNYFLSLLVLHSFYVLEKYPKTILILLSLIPLK